MTARRGLANLFVPELEDFSEHRKPTDMQDGRKSDESALCHRAGAAIAGGKVVGWSQGRMKWGLQALDNQSIPPRSDMRAILNAKIKRCESFQPFALPVFEEVVSNE